MALDILIVDDEAGIRDLISDIVKDEGYTPRAVADGLAAVAAVNETPPAAVILDIWLQGSELDGLGVLEIIKRKYPLLPVIVISGHGNIETAVNSIKKGAYDYLEKPFKEDRLLLVLKRAIEASRLKRENAELRLRTEADTELIGHSSNVNQLRHAIERLAPTSSRVMITGTPGVGKEVVARMIHKRSKRAGEAFVVLNAASLSADHVEQELFGVEDATNIAGGRKMGILERAHGGTLFIDGVSDLPLAAQAKLLRVLQERGFERPGTGVNVQVDVRVIASSSRDLKAEIAAGRLREDLFYRLNVVPLAIPSLAERKEDIPLLCNYFLKRCARLSGLPLRELGEDAIIAMQAYNWPGNVRQLKNVIEWLLIMAPSNDNSRISASMLPPDICSSGTTIVAQSSMTSDMISMPLREAREYFERQYLLAQLSRFSGNVSRTAFFIGMERSALHRKLKLLNITNDEKVSG